MPYSEFFKKEMSTGEFLHALRASTTPESRVEASEEWRENMAELTDVANQAAYRD